MLLDSTYGREALFKAEGENLWLARPVEKPGSRPLAFDGMRDLGSHLVEWPVNQTVKCLAFYHPDDPDELRRTQDQTLLQVMEAARTVGREVMIEIIAGKHGPLERNTVARVLDHLYAIGIKPDWWKLEPQTDAAAWPLIGEAIARHDPLCRGIVVLGLDRLLPELQAAFKAAQTTPWVKGFAVGRSIFGAVAEAWFAGRIPDEKAVTQMAENYASMCDVWMKAKGGVA